MNDSDMAPDNRTQKHRKTRAGARKSSSAAASTAAPPEAPAQDAYIVSPTGEPPDEAPPAAEPLATEQVADEPPAAEPVTEAPPAAELVAEGLPATEPSAAGQSTADLLADESLVDAPPTEEPPADLAALPAVPPIDLETPSVFETGTAAANPTAGSFNHSGEGAFVAVFDSEGLVGAFSALEEAWAAVAEYPPQPYAASWCPRKVPGSDSIWAVPFLETDSRFPAFVSDDRPAAVTAQRALAALGLVCTDSIDYWEQPFGVIVESAKRRLVEPTEEIDVEAAEALLFNGPRAQSSQQPAQKAERTVSINVLDSVVCCSPVFPLEASPAANCER